MAVGTQAIGLAFILAPLTRQLSNHLLQSTFLSQAPLGVLDGFSSPICSSRLRIAYPALSAIQPTFNSRGA
jgi:hypothetical protein